jgi:hypothetical protein
MTSAEIEIIACIEQGKGRKLDEFEIRVSLTQAWRIGNLSDDELSIEPITDFDVMQPRRPRCALTV